MRVCERCGRLHCAQCEPPETDCEEEAIRKRKEEEETRQTRASPQHTTTHHTTHHTTHSAPATLCNMREARHHYPQQDQAKAQTTCLMRATRQTGNVPRPMRSGLCCSALPMRCRLVLVVVCGVFCMWCLRCWCSCGCVCFLVVFVGLCECFCWWC